MAESNRKATMALGEQERIDKALAALAKDPHAAREITVRFTLHVHNEYPKHVTVGEDKDGNAITKVANNAGEEKTIRASAAPKEDPKEEPKASV